MLRRSISHSIITIGLTDIFSRIENVYDNACQAAIGKGLDPIGPTDFDANYITNLKDYAVLAAEWIVDYALTAPDPKP